MLTLNKLKEMEPRTIFATGEKEIEIFSEKTVVRWIAIRGGIHDWAIYYHHPDKSDIWISQHGDKMHDEDNIKACVPCDKEAFKMYRH